MHALLAGWRVSLHRTRTDWPIVAAAWLTTLLAAVLLAAGPIYASAAAVAGLRQSLADAPVRDATIQVSLYGALADAATADSSVSAELRRVVEPLGGTIVRDVRGAATLALSGSPAGKAGDQAILGFLDGLPGHASLISGSWPADGTGSSGPIQVVVLDKVATALGLTVGSDLSLAGSRTDGTFEIPVRLVGIYAADAAADPYWYGDPQLITGVGDNGRYRTYGPFLTTPADLIGRSGIGSLRMQWRAYPDFGRLTVDGATELHRRLDALAARVQVTTGQTVDVNGGLSTMLGNAERSLLVSRTSVLLVTAQLAILAAYAIVLTATLLVDHRRIDTALLRSRGAGTFQVALLALGEGLLLAIPAVLLAPWLAVASLGLLDVAGPLADVGLDVVPQVTTDAYVAAALAGAGCVALLVLPALLAARGYAAEERDLSRQETRTFGQRLGLDVALVAVTGIALWQLRLYGAPLTRTVEGSLGLDPLLVAAPAIGLLAGGVLALRVLPQLARAMEAVMSRRRDLVASLGSRQLARRPLRYTRSALLLMIAISMGVFAVSYSATWSGSQRDQAAYQAGADVRVIPGRSSDALPSWSLPSAYRALAGVERVSPVERIPSGISFPAGSADLLTIDAGSAAGIVRFRGDQSPNTTLADLMQALRAGRPEPALPTLPAGTAYLRLVPRIDTDTIHRVVVDPATGDGKLVPIDAASLADLRVSLNALVRDADGLMYRVESELVPVRGPGTSVVLPLEPASGQGGSGTTQAAARLDGPVELAALGIDVWMPQQPLPGQTPSDIETVMTGGEVGVASVAAGGGPQGPWTDVSLASTGDWSALMAEGRNVPVAVSADRVRGTAVQLTGDGPQAAIIGNAFNRQATSLSFVPASIGSARSPAPAIANRAFLSATATAPGDSITVTLGGQGQAIELTGAVDSFPTTDPTRPTLILDEPTLGLIRLQGSIDPRSPDEWWFAAKDGDAEALAGALRGQPFDSAGVVSAIDRTRTLSSDPVAVGIIGALAIGFVATGLFAIVGLTVSAAVAARQRRTEFALLRALGLSGRQLAGWLWLENGTLVLVSLLAGTGLGLVVAWLVLPFVTVTQQATTPVPPVIVQVPFDRILLLDVASALALGVGVVVIGSVLRRLRVGSILRMGED